MKNAWPSWRPGEIASVDSNILIYASAQDAGEKTPIARQLLRDLGLRSGMVSVQTLGEFFVTAVRKYKVSSADALNAIVLWQNAFTIIGSQSSVLVHAINIVDRYDLQFWDAMLLSAVKEAGANVLFSEDLQGGQIIDGVRIINPFV